jgi:hypothetical protein
MLGKVVLNWAAGNKEGRDRLSPCVKFWTVFDWEIKGALVVGNLGVLKVFCTVWLFVKGLMVWACN